MSLRSENNNILTWGNTSMSGLVQQFSFAKGYISLCCGGGVGAQLLKLLTKVLVTYASATG